MFLEGCVSRGYLDALRMAKYDILMTVESGTEAAKLVQDNCDLPDPADHDYEKNPWVRIYINDNLESILTPQLVVDEIARQNNLPLLINNPDTEIAIEVEERLKRDPFQ